MVVWSVTKGLVATCFLILEDRGVIELDRPVAYYWPEFAQHGKQAITCRTLLNHRGGLSTVRAKVGLADLADLERISPQLAAERPRWTPDTDQGYHAVSWGLFVGELFRRVAGETVGTFLRREVTEPLGAEVALGLPPELDAKLATLEPADLPEVLTGVLPDLLFGRNRDARVYRRAAFHPTSDTAAAFLSQPRMGRQRFARLNDPEVLRAELPWAGAVASARGIATVYRPLAHDGSWDGVRLVRPDALTHVTRCQSWVERDRVLRKPLGFSQGYCKDEPSLFSPNPEAFGHSGVGGALGMADPSCQLAVGYVMNRMDRRIRSPRCIRLCHAIYSALS